MGSTSNGTSETLQEKTQNQTQTTIDLSELKDLIKTKFSRMEVRLNSVDCRLNSVDNQISLFESKLKQNQEDLKKFIKEVELKAQNAFELSKANGILISEKLEKVGSQEHEIELLKETIKEQQEAISSLREDLEDTQNRGMRKTLIFRNIRQESNRETWEDTKDLLVREINKVMSDVDTEYISSKIERAHRGRENNENSDSNRILPIFAKFTDWSFSEKTKTSFIKAAKNSNSKVYVAQMYTSSLTKRRNKAMQKRIDLKKENKNMQAYVRYPAILMVKYEGQTKYSIDEVF